MKVLVLIVTVLVFETTALAQVVSTDNSCGQVKDLPAFYVTFLVSKNAGIIKNASPLNQIFQSIDASLTQFQRSSCSTIELKKIISETHNNCRKKCEENVKFVSSYGDKFKDFGSDCEKVCNLHLFAQQQYVAGMGSAKKNVDCINSKNDTIDDLSRGASKVLEEIPAHLNTSDKTISK